VQFLTETVGPRWADELAIVAAPGPSLTVEVADRCRGRRIIAVQDAYRLLPFADVLYGCDARWWDVHHGCPTFPGERWTCHGDATHNDKRATSIRHGLRVVQGKSADGFSLDPECIHYGSNSGFQGINLAILFGATRIVLVGFDMRMRGGKRHFFGDHPAGLHNISDYQQFVPIFERAARSMPKHIDIVNATPGTALRCFTMESLEHALPAETGHRAA